MKTPEDVIARFMAERGEIIGDELAAELVKTLDAAGYVIKEDVIWLDALRQIRELKNALNSTRLIMQDQESRDLAGEMVVSARGFLAAQTQEAATPKDDGS